MHKTGNKVELRGWGCSRPSCFYLKQLLLFLPEIQFWDRGKIKTVKIDLKNKIMRYGTLTCLK